MLLLLVELLVVKKLNQKIFGFAEAFLFQEYRRKNILFIEDFVLELLLLTIHPGSSEFELKKIKIGRPGWPAEMGLKGQGPFQPRRLFPQLTHGLQIAPSDVTEAAAFLTLGE